MPSPTWAEGPGRRTPDRTGDGDPDRKRRVSNCILRSLATLRPSPVAFATIYHGRLGGRVGASPLRNRDRKQAPGAEVVPVALTLDRGRLRRPELLPRASDMVPHWPSMSFGFWKSPVSHTTTILVRVAGAEGGADVARLDQASGRTRVTAGSSSARRLGGVSCKAQGSRRHDVRVTRGREGGSGARTGRRMPQWRPRPNASRLMAYKPRDQ